MTPLPADASFPGRVALRLIAPVIVLFWLGSVAWLCAVVWAPPGSRMERIDPREVYRIFFGWNESTTMTVLENGIRRGQIRIAGGSGPDAESGVLERVLSLAGSMERDGGPGGIPLPHLSWNGSLSFTETMDLREGQFSVRLPERDLNARLEFAASPPGEEQPSLRASLTMGGKEVFAFDAADGANPAAALSLLGPLGSVPGLLPPDPGALKLEPEARRGRFQLAGREIRAFLLTLRGRDPAQGLRIYLSEAGEPLRIESDLGFEAVSEILVPLEAYGRRPPK